MNIFRKKLLVRALENIFGSSNEKPMHALKLDTPVFSVYPYYTVPSDNCAKKTIVRFAEGRNTQEVLDFNLYLSPTDVWTGAVVRW